MEVGPKGMFLRWIGQQMESITVDSNHAWITFHNREVWCYFAEGGHYLWYEITTSFTVGGIHVHVILGTVDIIFNKARWLYGLLVG